MKRKDILSLSIAACLLAACSSSSDGGSNAVNPNPGTPSNPTTPSTPANPSTPPTPPAPTGTVQGVAYTADASGQNAIVHQLDGDNLETIVVGDTTVDLATPGINSGKSYILRTNKYTRMYSGVNYQYVKFGYYNEKTSKSGSEAIFAHGNLTDVNDLPTGTANYKGEAYGINLDTAHPVTGDSNFTVDFANKTVNGQIDAWDDVENGSPDTTLSPLEISATIQGNKFMQDANGVVANGAFYGPDAQSLGGVAHNQEVAVGFGAVKQ